MACEEEKVDVDRENSDEKNYITIESTNLDEILTVLNKLQEVNEKDASTNGSNSAEGNFDDQASVDHADNIMPSNEDNEMNVNVQNSGQLLQVEQVNDVCAESSVTADVQEVSDNIISIEVVNVPDSSVDLPDSRHDDQDLSVSLGQNAEMSVINDVCSNENVVDNAQTIIEYLSEDQHLQQNTLNSISIDEETRLQLLQAYMEHIAGNPQEAGDNIVSVEIVELQQDGEHSNDQISSSVNNIGNLVTGVGTNLMEEVNEGDAIDQDSENRCSDSNNKEKESYIPHVVDDYQEAKKLMKQHEEEQGWTYAICNTQVTFGNTDIYKEKHKVFWEMPAANIEFTAVPFIVAARRTFECQYGRMKCNQRKNKEKRESLGLRYGKNSLGVQSMKLGCPALLCMKEIVLFPDYKIPGKTHYRKQMGARKLAKDLEEKKPVGNIERKIVVLLPHPNMHDKHPHPDSKVEIRAPVHPTLYSLLQMLVWKEGVYNTQAIQDLLGEHCINVLFRDTTAPSKTNREYFPSLSTIRLRIEAAITRWNLKEQHAQQLQGMIQKYKEANVQDNFEFDFSVVHHEDEGTVNVKPNKHTFSPYQVSHNVFICHQTAHQQRMLKRYGDKLLIQNISCLFRRIPFPVCCLYTQTNVDWQLIGTFVILAYKKDFIQQALSIFIAWNPTWSPKFIICCPDNEILEAAEASFSNSSIFITDWSRNLDWLDWISNPGNKITEHANEVLEYVNAIANAYTEEDLNSSAARLEECEIWKKSEPLRAWFQSKWLRQAKRWVRGYRPDDFFECQTEDYSEEKELEPFEEIISMIKKVNLCDVVNLLLTDIIPKAEERYATLNRESFRKRVDLFYMNSDIPSYLGGMPYKMLSHMYNRMKMVDQQQYQVDTAGVGVFSVQLQSEEDPVTYTVEFGDSSSLPTCNCMDWQVFRLPCQHFCAVFKSNKNWTWDMLPYIYRANNCFTLDWSCLTADNSFGDQTKRDCIVQTEIDIQDCMVQTDFMSSDKAVQVHISDDIKPLNEDITIQDETSSEREEISSLIEQCNSVMHQIKRFKLAHCKRSELKLVLSYLKGAATVLSNSKVETVKAKTINRLSNVSSAECGSPSPPATVDKFLPPEPPLVLSTLLADINEKLGSSASSDISDKNAQNKQTGLILIDQSYSQTISNVVSREISHQSVSTPKQQHSPTLIIERCNKNTPVSTGRKSLTTKRNRKPSIKVKENLSKESYKKDSPSNKIRKNETPTKRALRQSSLEKTEIDSKKIKVEDDTSEDDSLVEKVHRQSVKSSYSLADVIIAYQVEEPSLVDNTQQRNNEESKQKKLVDTVNKLKSTLKPANYSDKLRKKTEED